MVKKIFIMRHGQTEWNRDGKQQGRQNSPLTEEGVQQAGLIAEKAASFQIQRLFTSPLGRALESAKIVGQAIGLEPVIDERLKESCFGLCEGLTRQQIDARFPDFWAAREESKWTTRWPDGESYKDVYQRVSYFAEEHLLTDSSDQCIGIMGHETTNKVLIGCLMNLSQEEIIRLGHPNNKVYLWQDGHNIQHLDIHAKSEQWRDGFVYKFNKGEKVSKFAFPIIHLYELSEFIPFNVLKKRFNFTPPQAFTYTTKFPKLP